MAHYHSHTKIIGRSAGRSAVAAAAYRAGEKLENVYERCVSDFSRRSGVLHTEILAPDGAASWVYDREQLWNRVEAFERRKDAQLAREVEVALPHELSHGQRLDLLRDYARQQFVDRGMVADIALHAGHGDERNVHAHIMLTLRELRPEGFGNKATEWNHPRMVRHWRREWARHQNRAYKAAGLRARVDERSYRDQGIDRTPTIHEGPKVRRMKARGFEPRSKAVTRMSPSGKRRVLDYTRLDRGRTRAGCNQQILWGNQARRTSDRLARLVGTHIHRDHFERTWRDARETGAALRNARRERSRASWLAKRAETVLEGHQMRLQDLVRLGRTGGALRDILAPHMLYRCIKLEQARVRLKRHARAKNRARHTARRLESRYRALRSRLGHERSQQYRTRLERLHNDALRAVQERDIRRSQLGERQKRALMDERARLREREDDRSRRLGRDWER